MKYAVIKTGGKQYKVSEGDIIEVERLHAAEKTMVFPEVLLYTADEDIRIGTPFIGEALVKGTIIEDMKGEKIRVARFKAKARYRKVMGHRQALTKVSIDSITLGEKQKTEKKSEAKTPKAN